ALSRLRAQARGLAVRALGPARVVVDGGTVRVQGLRLATLGGELAVDGRFDARRANDLRVRVKGLDLAALAPVLSQPVLAGALDLDAHLRGPLEAADVTANLGLTGLGFQGARVGDVTLVAHLTPRVASATVNLTDGPERRVGLEAELPVRANLAQGAVVPVWTRPGRLDLRLQGVSDAWFGPLAKLPAGVAFNLDGAVQAAGQAGAWAATVQLQGDGAGGPLAPVPFSLAIEAGPTEQRVALDAKITPPVAGAEPVPVTLAAQTGLALEPLLAGGPPDLDGPVDARITVPPVPLAPLTALLPNSLYDLQGTLSVDVRAKGPLKQPGLFGSVALAEGGLTVLPIGQRLSGLDAQIALDGRTVTLEGLRFKAAGGRGKLTAQATLGEGGALEATAGLRLDDFPVLAPGAPPLRVTTRVSVKAQQAAVGAPQVAVRLKGTDVELVELAGGGPRPIPTHPNITYVDARGQAATAAAQAQAEAAPAQPAAPLDLTVDLSDPVRIHGRILDMAWGGKVHVRTGPEPVLEGALTAQGGFVEMLGNRFDLADGKVTLAKATGPMPFLRIEAKTETPEAVVTAKIRGSAANPKLEFASEPALEESEILTLLVTGSTTPSEEDKQTVGEQAGALFATFSSPRFERALQDKLGVDRVRLTFGEGGLETPVLSFGKHVTRRLYVEARYRPNPTETENESELSARLKLRQRWTLESRYGDLGLGDVGLYWEVPLR
ncbi:MAG: translocation/assembly module TamB domain-containing protein, partial [Myxococcales bacterium]|nr:translocation/assembly module TamB domain-containing protein [Myxococcales bacterium]